MVFKKSFCSTAFRYFFQPNIQEDYVQRHKFQWAVCLPDTCQSEDVHKIVSNLLIPELNRHGMEGNVSIDPLLHTSNQNTYKYTAGFYLVWYVLLYTKWYLFGCNWYWTSVFDFPQCYVRGHFFACRSGYSVRSHLPEIQTQVRTRTYE